MGFVFFAIDVLFICIFAALRLHSFPEIRVTLKYSTTEKEKIDIPSQTVGAHVSVGKKAKTKSLLFLDVHTTDSSKDRPPKMIKSLFKNELVLNGTIFPRFVIPKGHSRVSSYTNYETSCGPGREGKNGMPCRIEQGYASFLKEYPDFDWYFRAIDDTYISPESLIRRVQKLNTFVDPKQHIVVKGLVNPRHRARRIHGGSGWMLSRAAMEFLAKEELKLDIYAHLGLFNIDDTTFTLILWQMFEKYEYWADPLFVSCEPVKDSTFSVIKELLNTNFSGSVPICYPRADIAPLNRMVSFHTANQDPYISLANAAAKAPDDIYVYINVYNFGVCRAPPGMVDKFDTTEYLIENTPLRTASYYAGEHKIQINRNKWIHWD